jgi:Myo-inositol oxygenase
MRTRRRAARAANANAGTRPCEITPDEVWAATRPGTRQLHDHPGCVASRLDATRPTPVPQIGVVFLVKRQALALAREVMGRQGFVIHASPFTRRDEVPRLRERQREIERRHAQQTQADVSRLRRRYAEPIVGDTDIVRLLELLAQVIDPASAVLACTSQLTHALQMAEAMRHDGLGDDLVFLALIHDIGKLALLYGEEPHHVDGNGRRPIGLHEPGIGLDRCTLTFAHGEIAYLRLGWHLPADQAWLLRYHDVDVAACRDLFDARDRTRFAALHQVLAHYDRQISPYRVPSVRLADFHDLLRDRLPDPILF